ncbi:outer membrane beta-barrel protein [Oxalobacteraceae bacterium A2-2]
MKTLYAGLLALAAGMAGAAEQSPWYAGVDIGVASNYASNGQSGRAYLGYELGTVQALEMQQVQSLELVGYSLGVRRENNFSGYRTRDDIRAEGVGLAWATALNLGGKAALHTRLGAGYTRADLRGQSRDYGNLLAGVGLSYAVNDRIRLRTDLSYTPVKLGRDDRVHHTMLSTGVGVAF